MIIPERTCIQCCKVFSPDGMTQRYCVLCGAIRREQQKKAAYYRRKERQRQQNREAAADGR